MNFVLKQYDTESLSFDLRLKRPDGFAYPSLMRAAEPSLMFLLWFKFPDREAFGRLNLHAIFGDRANTTTWRLKNRMRSYGNELVN